MVTKLNWPKKIAIYKVWLLTMALSLVAPAAYCQNKVWIGAMREYTLSVANPNQLTLQVTLEEYIKEGKFPTFDESVIVLVDCDADLQKWTITLDNIRAGKFCKDEQQFSKPEMQFLQKIQIVKQQGGFTNPSFTQTPGGRPILTARIVLFGYVPLHVSLKKVDKSNTSQVTLFFEISDQIPVRSKNNSNQSRIELTVNDFEQQKSVGNFLPREEIAEVAPKFQRHLEQLSKMAPGTFVTLVYKAKYQDVNLLRTQLDLLKSDVGQISVLEPNARVIIRDRSEYALEMLRLLLHLDTPVPQVIIDVGIVERNIVEGHDFFAAFSYLGRPNDSYRGMLGNDPHSRMNQGNANFAYVADDLLQTFQVNLNNEIKKGKARIRATTRIICKNREIAQFNSGNSIPYHQLQTVSRDNSKTAYDSDERTGNKSQSDSYDGTGQKLSGSSTNSSMQRRYDYNLGTDTDSTRWQIAFIQTGVNLWLRPYIKNSDWVDFNLKPSYSEITGMSTSADMPILSNRSLETSVTVKNGETIVIGGLIYEKDLRMRKGIPLLMDIPLLGSLFASEIAEKQQTEIVFIMTVYVQYPQ